jgi:hypothetical protein
MPLSIATLKAMIHDYHGCPLSDEELERIDPKRLWPWERLASRWSPGSPASNT